MPPPLNLAKYDDSCIEHLSKIPIMEEILKIRNDVDIPQILDVGSEFK